MTDAVSPTEQLVLRVERIERQNRRLRRALAGVAALCTFAVIALPAWQAWSQARGRAAIEGDRFTLRNNAGKLVGAFGVNNYGTANLVLLDKDERMRATIGVNSNGDPAFVLASPSGAQRLTMIHTGDGPGIILLDQNDKPRLLVSVEPDGRGLFQLIDPAGKVTWSQQ
jgi:hypothetical protein